MALKTIKIRVRPGDDGRRRREVEADVRGLFAYRRGTVTHVPTGYRVEFFVNRTEAFQFMKILNSQKGWNFSTLAEWTKRQKRMIKKLVEARDAAWRAS